MAVNTAKIMYEDDPSLDSWVSLYSDSGSKTNTTPTGTTSTTPTGTTSTTPTTQTAPTWTDGGMGYISTADGQKLWGGTGDARLWDATTNQWVANPLNPNPAPAKSLSEQATEWNATPEKVEYFKSQIPTWEQAFSNKDPAYSDYWNLYGAFPVNGSESDKVAWLQKAATGGDLARIEQDRVASDKVTDAFEGMLMTAAMIYVGASAFGSGAATLTAGSGAGAVAAADTIPELGLVANEATAAQAISQGIPAGWLEANAAGVTAGGWPADGANYGYEVGDASNAYGQNATYPVETNVAKTVLETVNNVRKVAQAAKTLSDILDNDAIDNAIAKDVSGVVSRLPFAAAGDIGFKASGHELDKSRLFAGLPAAGLVGQQMRRG